MRKEFWRNAPIALFTLDNMLSDARDGMESCERFYGIVLSRVIQTENTKMRLRWQAIQQMPLSSPPMRRCRNQTWILASTSPHQRFGSARHST